MFQEKIGVRAIRVALGVLAGSAFAIASAQAQNAPQRVEITGSSIKRIQVEGALPVQTITVEKIKQSGATNVAELIQALPAMQGFQIEAIAVGSNSGGNVSASIHDIGASYTLVLLNGRRLAPQGSGSTVNLNAIPMSAIERVEILTDGASALYGSDAIAGVINFIMKKDFKGVNIEATRNMPTKSGGGRNWNGSLTVGYGDLEKDRFSVMASYRHDDQDQIKATSREFGKSAYVPFKFEGSNYIYDRTSTAAIPANVSVTFTGGLPAIGFSPYLKKNGNCPERNFVSLNNTATVQNCAFDFGSTVEIVPESSRDSFFGKASFKLNNEWTASADLAISRLDLTARIAPNVAPFTVPTTSQFYKDNVLPHLTAAQAAAVRAVSGNYRTYDWGTRDSRTVTDSSHFVASVDGEIGGWTVGTGATWSKNSIDELYTGGYMLDKEFRDMLTNRSFDPFAPIGAQSEATRTLIKNSLFNGSIRKASTQLTGIDFRGSREVFKMAGGQASIGLGADYRQYRYEQKASAEADAGMIYNFNASPAYDMKRSSYGVFGELFMPIIKGLEVTAAVRYDSVGGIENGLTKTKMGDTQSASTYKVSARWTPTKDLLFRGSYGTGFKMPSMLDIGQPLVNNGFTATSWECPTNLAAENNDLCRPGKAQYNQYSGGNTKLKPETSKQYTLGFRYEPSTSFGVGMDLWDMKLKNAVSAVSQQQAFGDPVKFRSLFTTYTEPSTGTTYWAFNSLSVNIGKSHYRGIDWDIIGRHKFDFGRVSAGLAGTYMLKADYTKPGTDNDWTHSMNYFGINDAVTARNLIRGTLTLETGNFTNTLTMNYRDGYIDADTAVRKEGDKVNTQIRIKVPSRTTFDWQGRYNYSKNLSLRVGVKNLLDKDPPLSLRASSGHQVGFDPRYADPIGRQFYMTGSYTF